MCFGFPLALIIVRGTHFVNGTIEVLTKNFMIKHRKTITYHPQENDAVESVNKTLHKRVNENM